MILNKTKYKTQVATNQNYSLIDVAVKDGIHLKHSHCVSSRKKEVVPPVAAALFFPVTTSPG